MYPGLCVCICVYVCVLVVVVVVLRKGAGRMGYREVCVCVDRLLSGASVDMEGLPLFPIAERGHLTRNHNGGQQAFEAVKANTPVPCYP